MECVRINHRITKVQHKYICNYYFSEFIRGPIGVRGAPGRRGRPGTEGLDGLPGPVGSVGRQGTVLHHFI